MIKTEIQENDKGRQDIQRQRLTKLTITTNPHLPTIRCRRSKLGAMVGCIPLTSVKDLLHIVEYSSGSLLIYILSYIQTIFNSGLDSFMFENIFLCLILLQ